MTVHAQTFTTNFDSLTDGNLDTQDNWSAQTQWQVASGDLVNNTSGAFIRAHNTSVLGTTTIGESMTISMDFTLSAFQTPSNDIAGFEEPILVTAMSHQQGVPNYAGGISSGIAYDVTTGGVTGNLVLRQAGASDVVIATDLDALVAFASTTSWTMSTVYTKTADSLWSVETTLSGGTLGSPSSISGTSAGTADLNTDSDGGGILGGFQALPGLVGSAGVATGPFSGVTVTDYTMTVTAVPEPSTFALLVLGLVGLVGLRRRK